MSAVIRGYEAKVDSVDETNMSLVARINTSDVDYYNTVIDASGVDFKNYNTLGRPVLWEHGKDTRRHTDPIANGKWIRNNGGRKATEILAMPIFLKDDFSRQRFEWYRDGVIKGWSVNILPDTSCMGPPTKEELRSRPDWESAHTIFRQSTLAEFSGTVIPGNANALTSDRASKLLDLVQRNLLWIPDDLLPEIEARARTMTDSTGGLAGGGAAVEDAEPPGVPRYIRKKGDKWIVYSEAGKVLGTHGSESEAKAQLAAVEAHKHDEERCYVATDGQTWTIFGPDGKPIVGFQDSDTAEQCLALMDDAPRTFEQAHYRFTQEIRASNAQLKQEIAALLDLMVNGRV